MKFCFNIVITKLSFFQTINQGEPGDSMGLGGVIPGPRGDPGAPGRPGVPVSLN